MRHGFLIDMDGVIYRGREMVPGADRFINHGTRREDLSRYTYRPDTIIDSIVDLLDADRLPPLHLPQEYDDTPLDLATWAAANSP